MLKQFFSRQARKPSGWFGRIVATRVFDKGNSSLNGLMAKLVDPQAGDTIMEIGFGSGSTVRAMADKVGSGVVEGIDFSDAMMSVALKRNGHHIEAGRVRLTHGNFDTAQYSAESFDVVCSANTIYFWPDPALTCSRIQSVLRPGGRVVLAFVDKSRMETMPLDMDVFQPVSCDEVQGLLEAAGFASVEIHEAEGEEAAFCLVARK